MSILVSFMLFLFDIASKHFILLVKRLENLENSIIYMIFPICSELLQSGEILNDRLTSSSFTNLQQTILDMKNIATH